MVPKRHPSGGSVPLGLLSLILFIVIGANYFVYRYARQGLLEQIVAHAYMELSDHADIVENLIAVRVRRVQSWAQQPVMARVLDDDADHEIAELLDMSVRLDSSVRELTCTNRDGTVVASTNPPMLGTTVPSHAGLMKPFENGLGYQIAIQEREVIFTAPLLAEFDRMEVVGVLRMVIPAAELLPVEPVLWTGLVSASGDILAEHGVSLGSRLPLEAAATDPSKPGSVMMRTLPVVLPPGGEGPQCFFAMAERYDTLLAPVRVLRTMSVAATAGSSLVVILLITGFARRRHLLLLQLEESGARTQNILDSALDVIISMDARGVITTWNPQAEKVFGWTADEAVGRGMVEMIVPERFRDAHEAAQERFLQTGVGRVMDQRRELAALHRDGREFPIELSLSAVSSGGEFTFTGFLRDITERLQQEQEVRKLSQVVKHTSASVIITDMAGTIEFVNQAFVDITGYTAEEVKGKNPRILKSGLTPAQTYEEMWNELLAGRDWRGEVHNRRKNGELYWILGSISPLQDAQGKTTHYVSVQEDITLRKQMEDDLRAAARTDKLTGLANRALVCDRLQQAVMRAKRIKDYRFAVLFLDFDRFKLLNDTLGHDVGDLLLQEIARRMRQTVRSGDSLSRQASENVTARFGGDEFVVLLDGIRSAEDAVAVAGRLLEAFAQPYHLGEHEAFSTASIGIVTSDTPADNAEEVLRNADIAMYEAKLAGRGRYVEFDSSMHERVQNRLSLENDLRKALDSGQLLLMYQPIVSLETGEVAGFEALIRWNHPERGLIPPGEFIPIAEDTGLIIPIGEWVLREACRQFAAWRQSMGDAAPRSINVNVSRIQLVQRDLPVTIRRILEETGVAPSCLNLELTESTVMEDVESAVRILREIKETGVKLSLDDFGTGHSSLSCLHQLSIDVLKIDRSFVVNIDRGRDFVALIYAAVQLAHNLRISVVAEGVETMDQIATLLSMECEFGQGYIFSKPLMAADVPEFRCPNIVLPAQSVTTPGNDSFLGVAELS